MTNAFDLLQRHIQTLVNDNAQWQTLIADDILWELVGEGIKGRFCAESQPDRFDGKILVMTVAHVAHRLQGLLRRRSSWTSSANKEFRGRSSRPLVNLFRGP